MTSVEKYGEDKYALVLDEMQVLCVFEALVTQHKHLRKSADKHRKNMPTAKQAEQKYADIKAAHALGLPVPMAPWGFEDEECLAHMRGELLEVMRAVFEGTDLVPDETWVGKL